MHYVQLCNYTQSTPNVSQHAKTPDKFSRVQSTSIDSQTKLQTERSKSATKQKKHREKGSTGRTVTPNHWEQTARNKSTTGGNMTWTSDLSALQIFAFSLVIRIRDKCVPFLDGGLSYCGRVL